MKKGTMTLVSYFSRVPEQQGDAKQRATPSSAPDLLINLYLIIFLLTLCLLLFLLGVVIEDMEVDNANAPNRH